MLQYLNDIFLILLLFSLCDISSGHVKTLLKYSRKRCFKGLALVELRSVAFIWFWCHLQSFEIHDVILSDYSNILHFSFKAGMLHTFKVIISEPIKYYNGCIIYFTVLVPMYYELWPMTEFSKKPKYYWLYLSYKNNNNKTSYFYQIHFITKFNTSSEIINKIKVISLKNIKQHQL